MHDDYPNSYNPADSIAVARLIKDLAKTAANPNATSLIACTCKYELFLLKCLIEDLYIDLPVFESEESKWQQKRLIELLKR